MTAAQRQNTSAIPFRARLQPRPRQMPGIEGFYVLTASGKLGRYGSDGGFVKEPELTESLASAIDTVLLCYGSGGVDGFTIGVVTPAVPDSRWQSASLILSDGTLRAVYRTGDDPNAPLTSFQKRNKIKSLFRGMELLLDTMKASQPESHRYCPVLFQPEVTNEILRQRYGIEPIDRNIAFEVLDLFAPLSPEEQRHHALTEMVQEMRESRIYPELRNSPELMLIENTGDAQESRKKDLAFEIKQSNPWEGVRVERSLDVADGDPVTHWLLAIFVPFNDLNDMQRQFVARGHKVEQKAAGETLIERGSEKDVSIYLVKGTLELEAFDGKSMTILSGTERARLPISQLRPHAYRVKAATTVTVIFMSQELVRQVTRLTTNNKNRPGIEALEYERGTGEMYADTPQAEHRG